MDKQGFEYDGRYDWVLKNEGVKIPVTRDYNSAPRDIPRDTRLTKRNEEVKETNMAADQRPPRMPN